MMTPRVPGVPRPRSSVEGSMASFDGFMGFEEEIRMRPIDQITAGIPPREAYDLVMGGAAVAEIIAKEAPDIVFFPMRGAGPVEWVTEEMLRERRVQQPLFVELPLGTHLDSETHEPSGLAGLEKIALVNDAVQVLQGAGVYAPNETKLMIVDEVQKGGTITQASEALRRATRDRGDTSKITVVAVQDSRNSLLGDKRAPGFVALAANERPDFKTYVLPASLFTVDRSRYLDVIVRDRSREGGILDQLMVLHNEESRNLFRGLARAVLRPETAAAELAMIRQQELATDLAATALQQVVAEALTDPRTVQQPTKDRQLLHWWDALLRAVQWAEQRSVS